MIRRRGAKPGATGNVPFGSGDVLRQFFDRLAQAAEALAQAGETAGEGSNAGSGSSPFGRSGTLPFSVGSKPGRAVFGYTVRMGLDGMRAEPFGDVSPGEVPEPASPAGPRAARPAGSRAAATPNPQPAPRAPIVDVFDEGAEILVVAELPGAADDDVTCTLAATPEGTMLHIAATCAQPYRKTIALPVGIDHSSLRQACRNGILEVRLKRAAP